MIEKFLSALAARGLKSRRIRERHYMCQCPVHKDNTPSLSVKETNGRLVLHCFSCQNTRAVLDSIGWQWGDLFDGALEPRRRGQPMTAEDIMPFFVREASKLLMSIETAGMDLPSDTQKAFASLHSMLQLIKKNKPLYD